MRRLLSTFALALCVLGSGLTMGCRAGPPIREKVDFGPKLRIAAVAIYPFGFRWPEPAYRSFELSQRLFQGAEERTGQSALFFAPPDFRVLRPTDDNVWAATNLIALFPEFGILPEQGVVLRPWAEKRVLSARRQAVNARGKPVSGGVVEETTYLVHLEVLHPSTQTTIIQLDSEITVDPFSEKGTDDSDPTPELTRAALALTARAMALLQEFCRAPAARHSFGMKYVFNPQAAISYSEEGRSSLEVWLVHQDMVEAEVLKLNRVRFANPGLDDATAAQIARLPGGLFVTEVPAHSPLRPGDLITSINGKPALPQALQRARFQTGPVAFRLRRSDGSVVDVAVP